MRAVVWRVNASFSAPEGTFWPSRGGGIVETGRLVREGHRDLCTSQLHGHFVNLRKTSRTERLRSERAGARKSPPSTELFAMVRAC